MLKAAFVIAAALTGSGLAALAAAQESADDQFMPVAGAAHWYLQRSTCTLAHNVDGDSPAVVRFRIAMGVDVEFVDPALRNVRQGHSVPITIAADGVAEETLAMGVAEEGRSGYSAGISHELFDRIAAARRLEARTGGRTVMQIDLAGAGPAIAAMRGCHEAMAASGGSDSDMNMSMIDAMENAADAVRNGATPEG